LFGSASENQPLQAGKTGLARLLSIAERLIATVPSAVLCSGGMERIYLYFLGLAVFALSLTEIKRRAIRDVNVHLSEGQRFHFWSLWHVFRDISLWSTHRTYYPKSPLLFWYLFAMAAGLAWMFSL
jgi:hypothetical protein